MINASMELRGTPLYGVLFNTKNGNRYFFDNTTGMVFACPDIMLEILQLYGSLTLQQIIARLSLRFKAREITTFYRFIKRWYSSHKAFFKSEIFPLAAGSATPDELRNYLFSNGFKQLILNVTQSCNLRCSYCIYSDLYPNDRNFSNDNFSFETAKKAVDYYLKMFDRVRRRNPFRQPVITFYGGEPLLRFKLLSRVMDYAQSVSSIPIFFNLTSNATLLTDTVADYLVDHKAAISISLDGPRDVQDRQRTYADGRGTFDTVIDNLQRLKRRHPDYRYAIIMCTYDFGTDLVQVSDFFEEFGDTLPFVARVSLVSPFFTDYYNRFNLEDTHRFRKQKDVLRQRFVDQLAGGRTRDGGYLNGLIGAFPRALMMRQMFVNSYLPFLPKSRTCVPGDKLSVDTNGTYHLCEKMNPGYPIGNVDEGIDYTRISQILDAYHRFIIPECKTCPVSRLCSACYYQFGGQEGFTRQGGLDCRHQKSAIVDELSFTYSLLEDFPLAFENLVDDYYENLNWYDRINC